MKRLRIYLDTSVFGGYFDEEFSKASLKLFDEIKEGRYTLVVSTVTLRELDKAPKRVQELLGSISGESVEIVESTDETIDLRDAYLAAGIVGPAYADDAEHIACATIANVDIIVSWNFKHIVHYHKIRGYHAVNMLKGYKVISIHSPSEVIEL